MTRRAKWANRPGFCLDSFDEWKCGCRRIAIKTTDDGRQVAVLVVAEMSDDPIKLDSTDFGVIFREE